MSDVSRITVSPAVANYLEEILDDSDVPVAERVRKVFETDDDPKVPLYSGEINSKDRSITQAELQKAFKETQGSDAQQIQAASEFVVKESKTWVGQSIDTEEEARRFMEILTGERAHLLSGGAIIKDETSKSRRVSVRLLKQGLTWERFVGNVVPYTAQDVVGSVQISYEIPIEGKDNEFYLVTVVNKFGHWPTMTKIAFSRREGKFFAEWDRLEPAKAAPILRANKDRLQAAMKRAGLPADEAAVLEFLKDKIIDELSSIQTAKGYHLYDPFTNLYEYSQKSHIKSLLGIQPPDSAIFAAALATALHTVGDPRDRSEEEIAVWVIDAEGGEMKTKKDGTVKPDGKPH